MKSLVVMIALTLPYRMLPQTVTTVQNLGTIPAQQAANGLGFNVDPTNSFEFAAAQEVSSSWIRFDCGWTSVEIQNTNNTSGGYTWPSTCATGVANAKTYGQHPMVDALYGPTYQQISGLSVSSSTGTGAYVIPVASSSGDSLTTLATACFDSQSKPQCEVLETGNTQISNKWDYSGTLITTINAGAGTITVASATSVALSSSTALVVNQLLYSPVLLTYNSPNLLTDPSLTAYVHYAGYLASQIQAAGVVGQVGLWNEPAWLGGYWISGADLYDTPPSPNLDALGVQTVAAVAAENTPLANVTYTSNWTNLSGYASLFDELTLVRNFTTIYQAQQVVTGEAFHPYGNNPEEDFWSQSCLQQQALLQAPYNPEAACALVGTTSSSNFKDSLIYSLQPSNLGGITHNITETGFSSEINNVTARFLLRQFIGFQALGVSPIMFYKMSCTGGAFDWINCTAPYTPYQQFTDFVSLMNDINSIKGVPLRPWSQSCNDPLVASYVGYYPLDTVTMVGTQTSKTDQDNSELFFAWQQTYTSGTWSDLASPAAVPLTISISSGLSVKKIVDTVTLAAVNYTLTGHLLTFYVADNPVEVFLQPTSAATSTSSQCVIQ